MEIKGSLTASALTTAALSLDGGGTLGAASTDVLSLVGRLTFRAIADTSAAGQVREIAWSTADTKFAYHNGTAWTLFGTGGGGGGGTPGGSNTQFQFNDAGVFGGTAGLTWTAASRSLSHAGPSLTGSSAGTLFEVGQTWNTTGSPTLFRLNVTNTASAATSKVLDVAVDGASKLHVSTDAGGTVVLDAPLRSTDGAIAPVLLDPTMFGTFVNFGGMFSIDNDSSTVSVSGSQLLVSAQQSHFAVTSVQYLSVGSFWGDHLFDTDIVSVQPSVTQPLSSAFTSSKKAVFINADWAFDLTGFSGSYNTYDLYVTRSNSSATMPSGSHYLLYVGSGTASPFLGVTTSGLVSHQSSSSAVYVRVAKTSLSASPQDGLTLENVTAASGVTTVRMSPRLRFGGAAWNSAGSVSQTHDWTIESLPSTFAGTTTSVLRVGMSLNSGPYSYPFVITNTGGVTVTGADGLRLSTTGGFTGDVAFECATSGNSNCSFQLKSQTRIWQFSTRAASDVTNPNGFDVYHYDGTVWSSRLRLTTGGTMTTFGSLVVAGAVSGVTSLSMSGAISGVTSLSAQTLSLVNSFAAAGTMASLTPSFNYTANTASASGVGLAVTPTWNVASGTNNGTNNAYDLYINRTETSVAGVGGVNALLWAGVGGVARLVVANTGLTTHAMAELGGTPTDGVVLANTTAASGVATVQVSPRLRFGGAAWNSAGAVSQSHDWTIENLPVTNAGTTTSTFRVGVNPAGAGYSYPLTLTSAGALSVSGAISATGLTNNISTQRVIVASGGTNIGTRQRINFIQGSNVTLTVTDDSGSDRVDVTVAATGITTPPGGSNTQLQYNNAGSFGGTSGLTWDAGNGNLALTGSNASAQTKLGVAPTFSYLANTAFASSIGLSITPTWNVTSGSNNATNNAYDLYINRTETSVAGVGGTNALLWAGVGGTARHVVASTGLTTISMSSLGSIPTDGVVVANATAASGGATVQMSPRLRLRGAAWNSTGSASQTHDWTIENLPVTNAGTTTSIFRVGVSPAGAGYSYPLTLTSAGALSVSGSITATGLTNNISTQRVIVASGGSDIGTRQRVNFIQGTNVTLTVSDNSGSDRVDVTIAAASVSPGGSTTQLQYNNAGAFGGTSGLTWDATNSNLALSASNSSSQTKLGLTPTFAYAANTASASSIGLSITPTWNVTTGTNNATNNAYDLFINRTETSVGGVGGNNALIWAGVSGTARFSLGNTGAVVLSPSATTTEAIRINAVASYTGNAVMIAAQSSVQNREQFSVLPTWATSTDASRKARVVFNVWDTVAREAFRVEASGTAAMLGFFGASAVSQQTQSTDLKAALVNYGLLSSSSASTPLNLGTGTSAAVTAGTISLTASIASAGSQQATFAPTTSFTASGTQTATAVSVSPTWTITSVSGTTTTYDLYINRTETSGLTSGNHFLLWAGRGGTRQFSVDRSGTVTVGGALYTGTVSGGSVSTSATIDPRTGSTFTYTFTGNVTLSVNNGSSDGQRITIRITQDGGGSRTLTWGGSNIAFGTDITSVVLSTAAGKTDYIGLVWSSGASVWHVVSVVKGY